MPVYALDDLRPGQGLEGPAIVEAETTTVVINTADRLTVNALGWLDIRVGKALETTLFVMAGLVPAIHVFGCMKQERRGCPAQGRA